MAHTKLIQPRKSATLRTTLKKKARYRIWCAVDAHARLGMNGFFGARLRCMRGGVVQRLACSPMEPAMELAKLEEATR